LVNRFSEITFFSTDSFIKTIICGEV